MATISELVRERLTEEIPPVVRRREIMGDLPAPERFNRVDIIVGMRRSGKTFYLFQRMRSLAEQGVPRSRMLYFDFSDDRLPDSGNLIDEVIDEYWRQAPEARSEGAYLFLDEVQDCDEWQGACRRIAEHERVSLVVTGSSSKVSPGEIATQFRGRSHTHEMLPLSFAEYLRFHEGELPDGSNADELSGADGRAAFSPAERTALESLFDRYLVTGGFPAVQNDSRAVRIEVLQGYVRDVVARDVADRFDRLSVPLATQMALLVLRSTARELSVNGLVDALKAAGHRIGWEKASEMAALLSQAYLYFELREYSRTPLAGGTNPPKAYAIDPGLAYAVSRASQEDIGLRLETAAYLELRRRMAGRRTDSISSYTEPTARRRKVDFLVGESFAGESEPASPYALYQVALNLDDGKTRRRELESLDAAMAQTGLGEGTVITLRESGVERAEHGSIQIVPAWRWFLAADEG